MYVSLMVMDWILLTSRNKLCFFLLFILASCSHKKIEAVKEKEVVKNILSKNSLSKKITKLDYYLPTNITASDFLDKASSYGLSHYKSYRSYAVDFDHDRVTDLVLLNEVYSVPIFLKFDKKLNKYREINYSPFKSLPRANFLQFADFNHDGIYDLVIGTLNQNTQLTPRPLQIYKGNLNNKGQIKYKLMKNAFNKIKASPTSSIAILDFDLDGRLDIYEGLWTQDTKVFPDRLWRGTRDGFTFKDYSIILEGEHDFDKDLKIYKNAAPTNSVTICDVNSDGRPDILTASGRQFSNKLWLNTYKISKFLFKDIGHKSHYSEDDLGRGQFKNGGNTMSVSCQDYNNDGIEDIFIGEMSSSFDPDTKDRSSVLTGKAVRDPSYIRSEYRDEDTPNWTHIDRASLWLDYNNDGLEDLLVENSGLPPKTRLLIFKQETDHAMESVDSRLGIDIVNPVGTNIIDVNGDGKLDILVGQSNTRDHKIPQKTYLFINNSKNNSRSIKFYLRGDKANFYGLGATIKLKTSKDMLSKFVHYGTSRAPGNREEGIHFGIGESLLKKVYVTWPILIKGKIHKKVYNLSSFKFKKFLNITLCESGKLIIGKKDCLN